MHSNSRFHWNFVSWLVEDNIANDEIGDFNRELNFVGLPNDDWQEGLVYGDDTAVKGGGPNEANSHSGRIISSLHKLQFCGFVVTKRLDVGENITHMSFHFFLNSVNKIAQ